MKVINTYIVIAYGYYQVLYECEKNTWFLTNNHYEMPSLGEVTKETALKLIK